MASNAHRRFTPQGLAPLALTLAIGLSAGPSQSEGTAAPAQPGPGTPLVSAPLTATPASAPISLPVSPVNLPINPPVAGPLTSALPPPPTSSAPQATPRPQGPQGGTGPARATLAGPLQRAALSPWAPPMLGLAGAGLVLTLVLSLTLYRRGQRAQKRGTDQYAGFGPAAALAALDLEARLPPAPAQAANPSPGAAPGPGPAPSARATGQPEPPPAVADPAPEAAPLAARPAPISPTISPTVSAPTKPPASPLKPLTPLRLVTPPPAPAPAPSPEPAATLVFERLLAKAYQKQGFQVVELPADHDGSGHSDGAEEMLGTDLLLARGSERVLVSCRHWRAVRVGVEAVSALRRRMVRLGVPRGCLVTASRYTLEAWALAHVQAISLIDGDSLHELLADVLPALQHDPEPTPPGGGGDGDGRSDPGSDRDRDSSGSMITRNGGGLSHPAAPGAPEPVIVDVEHIDPAEPDPRLPPLGPAALPAPTPRDATAHSSTSAQAAAPSTAADAGPPPRPAPRPAPGQGPAPARRSEQPPLFSDRARGMAPLAARQPGLPGLASEVAECPRCGRPMVLRQLRRGDPGSPSFWGCTGYPACGERRLVA